MTSTWESIGVIRWPLAFSFVVVLLLAAWSAYRLYRGGARPDLHTKAWLDAILFWGGFAFVTGVLGTLVGIIIASRFIEASGEISTSLVWGGIGVALLSSAAGALILGFAALLWFVLQMRWRLLQADLTEAAS